MFYEAIYTFRVVRDFYFMANCQVECNFFHIKSLIPGNLFSKVLGEDNSNGSQNISDYSGI